MLSTAAQGKSTLCPAGRQEGSRQHRLRSTAASHWFEQQAPCTNSIMSIPARAAHSPAAFSSHSPTPWCWLVFPGTRQRATGFFFFLSIFFFYNLVDGWVSFLSSPPPPSSCWVLFLSFLPPLLLVFAFPPSLPSHPLAPHYTSSRLLLAESGEWLILGRLAHYLARRRARRRVREEERRRRRLGERRRQRRRL